MQLQPITFPALLPVQGWKKIKEDRSENILLFSGPAQKQGTKSTIDWMMQVITLLRLLSFFGLCYPGIKCFLVGLEPELDMPFNIFCRFFTITHT
jgi:hypothetical protein